MAVTLELTVGMFALSLWDRREIMLTLARDRMGEKPLYPGYAGAQFVFGSELKALVDIPGFDKSLDRRSLSLLLRHNYIPAPWCIYRSLRKLRPGMLLTIDETHFPRRHLPEPPQYW